MIDNESKEYDVWNRLKKKIQSGSDIPNFFPQEGEVWMSSLGKNIGFEQNGSGANFSRPILVVKKFNNHMFWCTSLSTKQKKFDFYYNFTDPNREKVSVILAQLKLVSVKRLKRKLYDISSGNFTEIKCKLRGFLE
ncbi:MAG TPA: type II toxin-antitoxin system PemK/MazF family toxin [Candidatus Paceibacterota bacterium]